MKTASIPMKSVGPIKIIGPQLETEVSVPMATFETPLWPSVTRGAKVTALAGGITALLHSAKMTRSVIVKASRAEEIYPIAIALPQRQNEMQLVVQHTSQYAQLLDVHCESVGNLLFIRFGFDTNEASGHNMATKSADALLIWMLEQYPELSYSSISGNLCTDKKVSAVNGILGRGKSVTADCLISHELCDSHLRTTPDRIATLNYEKNWVGSNLAGSLRSANAHVANILLAIYLTTGQDAANIVEGSQAFTHTEARDDGLYISVTLPNLIVGTIGNGKALPFVIDNLAMLGCNKKGNDLLNSHRLAIIIASTVLCGELSLIAAQTNPGELMRSHALLERKNTT